MAVNEVIVTGRKFRKLLDEATKLWQRVSFWTKACDVEFDDGFTAEQKLGNLKLKYLTTEQYNNLAAKDSTTLYFIE